MRITLRTLSAVVLGATAGGAALYHHRINAPIELPVVQPVEVFAGFFTDGPVTVMTTVAWRKFPITVSRWEFRLDQTVWQRMHFGDWDRLPDDLRTESLDRLLTRYGRLVSDRLAWECMAAHEWDGVPQPIRAMAIVGMIEFWVRHYQVGVRFGLDPDEVMRTVKAIAMSESWFEHRAQYTNSDGSIDLGIGGASAFARRTIRRWHEQGRADFTMADEDYDNPWLAARWLAFWSDLTIQEAQGNLELAIRAYNTGIGRASKGDGQEYFDAVNRRRRRFFEGPSNSPTWQTLSQFRRQRMTLALAADEATRVPDDVPPAGPSLVAPLTPTGS